jgi:transcription elongation factor SPT4
MSHEENVRGDENVGQASSRLPAAVPEALNRNLRCCNSCHLVKTLEQFYQQGCENCSYLEMAGDRERIEDCTTTEFQGMLGVIDPDGSWAARYAFMQREVVPGVYALSVDSTNLQPAMRQMMEEHRGAKLQ